MRKLILATASALLISTSFAVTSHAQDPSSGSLMHNPAAVDWEMRGNNKKITVVDADLPSGQAINARIKKRQTTPWDISLWFDLRDEVKKGDKIAISFWARTEKAPKGQELSEIVVYVGRNEEPYDRIISEEFMPGKEWKLYTLEAVSESYMPKGEVKAEFQLGKHKQTIEFGPVFVKNLGQ